MEKVRVQKCFSLPSRTKQAFKQSCDINLIMKRFKNVQGVDYLQKFNGCVSGSFGDFSDVPDYRSALEQVRRADEVFMRLPAKVRARFENDAALFLDFCHDPANKDELVSLGLANAPQKGNADTPAKTAASLETP